MFGTVREEGKNNQTALVPFSLGLQVYKVWAEWAIRPTWARKG